MKCPACNGTGNVHLPAKRTKKEATDVIRAAAFALRESGFTIREIANKLGYKHPGSISHLLDSEKHKGQSDD